MAALIKFHTHIAIVLIFLTSDCLSSRILCFLPTPIHSHQTVYKAFIKELASRGHELVVVTAYASHDNVPFSNITEIDVGNVIKSHWKTVIDQNVFGTYHISDFDRILNYFAKASDALFRNVKIEALINDPNEQFDLVILEFYTPPFYALVDKFKAPTIGFTSSIGYFYNHDYFNVPTHPFIYNDITSDENIKHLSLGRKILLAFDYMYRRYIYYRKYVPIYDDVVKKHFGPNIDSVEDLARRIDAWFLNVSPMFVGSRPVPPNVIYLDNIHVERRQPLKRDLYNFLENSPEGVIYFSLGNDIVSTSLPAQYLKLIQKSLGSLPYKVLWKWEDDVMDGKPDNVHIYKWLPQNDIFAHPNIKVFLTQGDMPAIEIAIQNYVPIVGLPLHGDQAHNLHLVVEKNIGVSLDITTLTSEKLTESILEVAKNESYRKNVRKISQLMNDQITTGLERAIWWTDYLLRHGSAEHLRPASVLTSAQYFMLDLVAAVLISMFILVVALYAMFVIIIRILWKDWQERHEKKKLPHHIE